MVKELYTVEEYFALEEEAKYKKNEYYKGEILPMPNVSIDHQRIATNTLTVIHQAFENCNCEVFSSRLKIEVIPGEYYTYPDVVVLCGEIELYADRDDTIVNPSVIIEVLSKSTASYDKGEKFERYKVLASLQNYLLIDQWRVHVECYRKLADDSWGKTTFRNLNDIIKVEAVDVEISLTRIYNKVNFASN